MRPSRLLRTSGLLGVLSLALCALPSSGATHRPPAASARVLSTVDEHALDLPPVHGFLANVGQAPGEVLYYGSSPAGVLYLTRNAIVIDRWESVQAAPAARPPGRGGGEMSRHGRVLYLRFAGANGAPLVEVEGEQSPRFNFLKGNMPSAWHRDVRAYASVQYRELWPGIDLKLTATRGHFGVSVSAPAGIDASTSARPRFELDRGDGAAAEDVGLATVSDLLADLGSAFDTPDAGSSRAADDPSALTWSTYIGGGNTEFGTAVALDSEGRAVVAGGAYDASFPTTPGAYDRTAVLHDAFVSKFSANGDSLLWSTFLGGSMPEEVLAMALDSAGRPVMVGDTHSWDFPIIHGAYDGTYNGGFDGYVAKLDATGSSLVWSTFLGGEDIDVPMGVALDRAGNAVVAGYTTSLNYPVTAGAYDVTPNGGDDVFVTKLSSTGSALLWSTLLGGSSNDYATAVRFDASDAPVVCGDTSSPDFPGGASHGFQDIFVTKFTPAGDALTWSSVLGGTGSDDGYGLALNSRGDLVVCGNTASADFPVTPGAFDTTQNGDDDAFAMQLRGSDGAEVWATFAGGWRFDAAWGVAPDAADRPVLVGTTQSDEFPVTEDAYDPTHNGGLDVFVLCLDPTGSSLQWSSFFGGSEADEGLAIAAANSDIVMTGRAGSGFPVTAGAYDETYDDNTDVFVARVSLPALHADVAEGGTAAGAKPSGPLGLRVAPHPVGSSTRIAFTVPSSGPGAVDLFDIGGHRHASLDLGMLSPGLRTIDWSALRWKGTGEPPAAGVYFLRVTVGGVAQTSRIVLAR